MKKYSQYARYMCYATIILLFMSVILPSCTANINMRQTNEVKVSQDSPVKKMKQENHNDESFFDIAIIWGTFEWRGVVSLFGTVIVGNPKPWYNLTMNVIGYQIPEHKFVVKKAFWIQCNFLHLGFVGKHRLFVIGLGNIDAFS